MLQLNRVEKVLRVVVTALMFDQVAAVLVSVLKVNWHDCVDLCLSHFAKAVFDSLCQVLPNVFKLVCSVAFEQVYHSDLVTLLTDLVLKRLIFCLEGATSQVRTLPDKVFELLIYLGVVFVNQ